MVRRQARFVFQSFFCLHRISGSCSVAHCDYDSRPDGDAGDSLFALSVISLCATQEINWTLLAIFEATAAFFLAYAAIIRQRRSRALRDEELNVLKGRLSVIEARERLRCMKSLHDEPRNMIDSTGLLTLAEDAPDPKTDLALPLE